jgi:hypothetical protein
MSSRRTVFQRYEEIIVDRIGLRGDPVTFLVDPSRGRNVFTVPCVAVSGTWLTDEGRQIGGAEGPNGPE